MKQGEYGMESAGNRRFGVVMKTPSLSRLLKK